MLTGKIKFFSQERGYGFIVRDDGQPDIFVHCSAVRYGKSKDLKPEDQVEFEVETGHRGPKAAHVRLIEPAAAVNPTNKKIKI